MHFVCGVVVVPGLQVHRDSSTDVLCVSYLYFKSASHDFFLGVSLGFTIKLYK